MDNKLTIQELEQFLKEMEHISYEGVFIENLEKETNGIKFKFKSIKEMKSFMINNKAVIFYEKHYACKDDFLIPFHMINDLNYYSQSDATAHNGFLEMIDFSTPIMIKLIIVFGEVQIISTIYDEKLANLPSPETFLSNLK